ncbi:nuclear transport factor 2 family protein [Hymenobacter lucidus]|uniref:Nuclear transport factor 2 family protein n=1 Tax=Hymenobacter lucidus TaxID=2880930 RepID=A0ABS8AS54_9BACT|nr:nuclear transport factor 2 family protein [Hymenobacter lucidus]MCB2409057.1 nuclear transport factor 2 family protein [Hymenobacter lucidus]
MKRIRTAIVYITLVCITAACSTSRKSSSEVTESYKPASKELYKTIYHMDSVLFDAFNNRNLEIQKMVFATNLEFYHDNGGLTNYNQVIENTRRLFDQNNGLRRTLIPGSLQVYPIKDYGAIEIGIHRFCHPENGKDDCGTFKFIHIWQKRPDGWKLTRVISYDH